MTVDYQKNSTLLKVESVSLKLGGKQILRDINLDVKDIVRPQCITGQVVALIGQSGSGKSTLFSLLSGIRKPDTVYILSKQQAIEGATITKEIDLIERGLSWHKDVKEMPEFIQTLKEIKSLL